MPALQEYKCPCCGGAISFNSDIQKMKCPYCDTQFEMETLKALDKGIATEQPDKMKWDVSNDSEWQDAESEKISAYVCKSCGGEIIADENTAATTCPYCGNPVTLTGRLSGMLKPDCVIPFKLDKEAAKKGFSNHLSKKRLLPKVFKTENHIDEVKGVYVPFWLFDADADADIQYRATNVRFWSDSNYNYTETSYFQALRSGMVSFSGVPVDGSTKMEDDLMESLEPFNMREAVDFQTAYLAGYVADKYDVDKQSSTARANSRIKASTEELFRSTVTGYQTVETRSSSIRFENGTAKYALLPIWILNTTWKNKKYTFAMNGQTGKFVGNLPVDRAKYWKLWALYTAIGTAVFAAVNLLLFL